MIIESHLRNEENTIAFIFQVSLYDNRSERHWSAVSNQGHIWRRWVVLIHMKCKIIIKHSDAKMEIWEMSNSE